VKIVGISGSLRADSYNTKVLRAAGEYFDASGVEFTLYDELKAVPPYDEEDDVETAPAAVSRLRDAVAGASTGMFGAIWAQAELRKVLASIGARVVEGEVAVGHAHTRCDGERLADDDIRKQLNEVADMLVAEVVESAEKAVAA
jgi:chromate reductase